MKIKLLFAGKTDNSYLKEGINDYIKRLSHYVNLEVEEVVTKGTADKNSILQKEAEKMLLIIKPSDYVIILDERGEQMASAEFARAIESIQNKSIATVVFICGSAYGFHELIYKRSNKQLALSKMTFTHQMVRLIFVEQLYRAYTILNNEKYHH